MFDESQATYLAEFDNIGQSGEHEAAANKGSSPEEFDDDWTRLRACVGVLIISRHDDPTRRQQIPRIEPFVEKPWRRRNDDLVGRSIHPGAPPAERAVRQNVVLARAHQLNIAETALRAVDTHLHQRRRVTQVVAHPVVIIRKYVKDRVGDA